MQLALTEERLDALVCSLPMNVLLLSGYWPVVGTGVALALPDGAVYLLVPEDEKELAAHGRADRIETFHPSSLDKLTTAAEAIAHPLHELARNFLNAPARIGFEQGEITEPASYANIHIYQGSTLEILKRAFPSATPVAADDLLANLRCLKTTDELAGIAVASQIAATAFHHGAAHLRAGMTELEAADCFQAPLSTRVPKSLNVQRAGGFTFCMSGANSAQAYGAYARSRSKRIEQGELVLVHCNSYADGYWTDITRTYVIGNPEDRQVEMYEAVFTARDAALREVAAGRKASDVDKAARSVLQQRGFGSNFKHSTGHGIGFSAINPNARPRLHPKSDDTLELGMVFNIEPAVYIQGYGGIRHCDMIAITEIGPQILTEFQTPDRTGRMPSLAREPAGLADLVRK